MTRESVPAGEAKSPGSLEPSETFLAEYYAQVPPEDLRSHSPETLRARAGHHLKVASSRAPGQAAVGILTELDASVVAVVTDDIGMPGDLGRRASDLPSPTCTTRSFTGSA